MTRPGRLVLLAALAGLDGCTGDAPADDDVAGTLVRLEQLTTEPHSGPGRGTEGSWTKVMALSPDERTIYAANWSSNDVSAVDLATGSVRRYPTVRTPRGLFPTPDGKRLCVAGYEDGRAAAHRASQRRGHGPPAHRRCECAT